MVAELVVASADTLVRTGSVAAGAADVIKVCAAE
jgi:hypothetical protein